MRSRAPALAVVAFAVTVALIATLAGRDGGGAGLVKLPFAAGGESAPAEADTAGTTSARSAMVAAAVDYQVKGTLVEPGSTAPAYRIGSATDAEAVAGLARALGLDGPVVEEDEGWSVTTDDHRLSVQAQPGLPWYLGASCPDSPEASVSSDGARVVSSKCAVAVAGGAGVAGVSAPGSASAIAWAPTCPAGAPVCKMGEPGAVPVAAPGAPPPPTVVPVPERPLPPDVDPAIVPAPELPPRPAGLPTREEAEAKARDLFERLGTGMQGFALDDGWSSWHARVEARVGDLPVLGFDSSVAIGVDGRIEWAQGWLAVPEKIGDYPLAGVATGLQRLKDQMAQVQTLEADGVAIDTPAVALPPGAEPAPAIGDCSDPAVSCPVPFPLPRPEPLTVTVQGVHVALTPMGGLLVPVYVFEVDDGPYGPWAPAVTDEWLTRETGARD